MKSPSALTIILLLTFTTSSFCLPLPVPVEECTHYASCRPSFRSKPPHRASTSQSKFHSPLNDPYFPPHQLESQKQEDDRVEVRLLLPPSTPHSEPAVKNAKLNVVLKTALRDKTSSQKPLNRIQDQSRAPKASQSRPAATKTEIQNPTPPHYSLKASVLRKVSLVATKCSRTRPAAQGTGDKVMQTTTYTYGYNYMRTEYTSILVVSIVVIFILAVVVVELLDGVLDGFRALFGLDGGAIRLEDSTWDCEKGYPRVECTPNLRPATMSPARWPSSGMLSPVLEEDILP